ncbi:hypothetical protein L596_013881 [Steinernema carpocapsae]|uniref:TIL domain-containing protein n=1 Tax=Steinernema carpocapsae TaxID=34508 RepID=A0A4U5P1H2_STECR|nr:hypothetical protein L596_013881 [Steinernema carpocapsae]
MKLLILALFVIVVAVPARENVSFCQENEVDGGCNQCETSCENARKPCMRLRSCLPRPPTCLCKKGFFRNRKGDCVTYEQCATDLPPTTHVPTNV